MAEEAAEAEADIRVQEEEETIATPEGEAGVLQGADRLANGNEETRIITESHATLVKTGTITRGAEAEDSARGQGVGAPVPWPEAAAMAMNRELRPIPRITREPLRAPGADLQGASLPGPIAGTGKQQMYPSEPRTICLASDHIPLRNRSMSNPFLVV